MLSTARSALGRCQQVSVGGKSPNEPKSRDVADPGGLDSATELGPRQPNGVRFIFLAQSAFPVLMLCHTERLAK
eukprot:scaffold7593_cov248-Pinguiococcus_pyrenoidosus.AAC.2